MTFYAAFASGPLTGPTNIASATGSAVYQLVLAMRNLISGDRPIVADRLPTERERFSASRDTVRQAMRTSKAYGVVEVRPKVGAATAEEIANLRLMGRETQRSRTMIEASEQDFRFHTQLVSLAQNKSILDVCQIVKPVILRIMQRGKTRRTIEGETFSDHEGILDARVSRDNLGFQFLMRTQLRAGFATF